VELHTRLDGALPPGEEALVWWL